MYRLLFVLFAVAVVAACSKHADPTDASNNQTTGANEPMTQTSESNDPYLWLEEVEGDKALAWVREQNERSLGELTDSALYQDNLAKATEVLTSDERIPYSSIRDGLVYNFWQDTTHVRGVWRRTTLASYQTDTPDWETVLDIDALSKTEDKNWVYKGVDCLRVSGRDHSLCLISLSDGGKDAVVVREFDLASKKFVADGFVTPEAKQGTAWIDADTLAIGTDWGGDGST